MNYEETLDFLYNCYPVFESQGQSAYKPGLYNTERIDELLGHPHQRYKTIHVAGTNGKGSVSHLIASTLQKSGLKTGLYTSPHIADFGERIRVNGEKIDRQYVTDFVEKHKDELKDIHPSFFEFTMEMAFQYFADEQVDVAVIEVGLGGRLDSTNIITPDLSVITNISLDHTNLLGDTLELIAAEKAGIIKKGVPVVIGERVSDGVAKVFEDKAKEMGAPIFFAEECFSADKNASNTPVNNSFDVTAKEGNPIGTDSRYINITNELNGEYQQKNTVTALTAIEALIKQGYGIKKEHILDGFATICQTTGLIGRWQKIAEKPDVICDMGHNEGAIRCIRQQLDHTPKKALRVVFGMVKDKDVDTVLGLMPKDATYYFCNAPTQRALPADEIKAKGEAHGLHGDAFPTPMDALRQARHDADERDLIFVGGSAYILAEIIGKA